MWQFGPWWATRRAARSCRWGTQGNEPAYPLVTGRPGSVHLVARPRRRRAVGEQQAHAGKLRTQRLHQDGSGTRFAERYNRVFPKPECEVNA